MGDSVDLAEVAIVAAGVQLEVTVRHREAAQQRHQPEGQARPDSRALAEVPQRPQGPALKVRPDRALLHDKGRVR